MHDLICNGRMDSFIVAVHTYGATKMIKVTILSCPDTLWMVYVIDI